MHKQYKKLKKFHNSVVKSNDIVYDFNFRRIAGLNSARADKIIEWRRSNGPFTNRQQLLKVKGISAKTFEQCAGFVRVIPETVKTKYVYHNRKSNTSRILLKTVSISFFVCVNNMYLIFSSRKFFGSSIPKEMKNSDDFENPLDRTWIHPESYSVARR